MRAWLQGWLPSEGTQLLWYGTASALLVVAIWIAAAFRSRAWNPKAQLSSEEVGLLLRGPCGAVDAALSELLLQGAFRFHGSNGGGVDVLRGGRTALQQACAQAMRAYTARRAEQQPSVQLAVDNMYRSLAARGIGGRAQSDTLVDLLVWLLGLINLATFVLGWIAGSPLFAVSIVGYLLSSWLVYRCTKTHKVIREEVWRLASASVLSGDGPYVSVGPVIGARVAIDSALWGPNRTLFELEPAIIHHRVEPRSESGGGSGG